MAWIESHEEIMIHPKTKKLARLLDVSLPTVIGHLHILWWWALKFAEDGNLSKYEADDIADAAMWEGDSQRFLDALIKSGFVDHDGEGMHLHDWHDYAGKLIERRKADAERKQKERSEAKKGNPTYSRECPVEIQRTSNNSLAESMRNPNHNQDQHQNQLPEKEGESESKEKHSPSADDSSDGVSAADERADNEYSADFLTFWGLYPRKVGKREAWRKWQARVREKVETEDMINAARHYAEYCRARGTEPQYIKHAATFLGPTKPYEEFVHGPPEPIRKKQLHPSMQAIKNVAEEWGVSLGGIFDDDT